jgi:hypothetical protein
MYISDLHLAPPHVLTSKQIIRVSVQSAMIYPGDKNYLLSSHMGVKNDKNILTQKARRQKNLGSHSVTM